MISIHSFSCLFIKYPCTYHVHRHSYRYVWFDWQVCIRCYQDRARHWEHTADAAYTLQRKTVTHVFSSNQRPGKRSINSWHVVPLFLELFSQCILNIWVLSQPVTSDYMAPSKSPSHLYPPPSSVARSGTRKSTEPGSCLINPLLTGGDNLCVLLWTRVSQLPRWLSGEESSCQCRRCGFHPWMGKIPWRRKWQHPPVFWPGESHGRRTLVGYSPWGRKEPDTT